MCSKKWINGVTFFFFFFFSACESDKEEPNALSIRFELTHAAQAVTFNTIHQHESGYRFLVNLLKVYFHKIYFHTSGFDSVQVSNLRLIDFNNSGSLVFESPIKENTNFIKISGFIGVPEELNGTNNAAFDPSVYGNDSPLSLNNNMYWTWNTGFIF